MTDETSGERLEPPTNTVKMGTGDPDTVRAIQRRLNALGCGPVREDGAFGPQTATAVRLFQARFTDSDGLPLKVDGEVGPLTWHALFGVAAPLGAVPAADAPPPAAAPLDDSLLARVLATAAHEIGVMEVPLGSNRGPRVDEYLRSVGLDPTEGSFPWCAAFVFWCFANASQALNEPNPAVRSAGVMDHWRKAGLRGVPHITAAAAAETPAMVRGGLVFVMSTGAGTGHMGFVEGLANGKLITIEGNTNDGGSREGVGVFRRSQRKISDVNVGFVDYAS